jgi:hypothetical protein
MPDCRAKLRAHGLSDANLCIIALGMPSCIIVRYSRRRFLTCMRWKSDQILYNRSRRHNDAASDIDAIAYDCAIPNQYM